MKIQGHVITIIFCLFALSVSAQELKVKSFEQDASDLSAQTYPRKDNNDTNCALVKVGFGKQGCLFEGGIMGSVENKTGEYWVYMPKGNRFLKVKHLDYSPLMVTFADYGVEKLESNRTYILTISAGEQASSQADAGGNFLALTVNPANAIVVIDGKMLSQESSGEYMPMLSYGEHSYEISAGGYVSKKGVFTINRDDVTKLSAILESSLAAVSVKVATSGAFIYIDKKQVGSDSWSGSLQDGMHLIEVKKDGYRSQQKSIQLTQQQKLSVKFDELVAITGNLSVSYKPIGADIYLDGTKVGQSPKVINSVLIGKHKIDVKQDGYRSNTQNVNVVEDKTQSISGVLEEIPIEASLSVDEKQGLVTLKKIKSSPKKDKIITIPVNDQKISMVYVEGGSFTMGATSEKDDKSNCLPTHQVTLSDYYIGLYEVTQSLWQAVMGSNPSRYQGNKLPVENVSWFDCQDFISKLNSLTGRNFRLPTEAEWEYAARGGNKSNGYTYSGSNNLDKVGWYIGNFHHVNDQSVGSNVGKLSPNELGIYDMSGNVSEWCQDWYGKYSSYPQTNPLGLISGEYRVARGGCGVPNACSASKQCTNFARYGGTPHTCECSRGFRLALSE